MSNVGCPSAQLLLPLGDPQRPTQDPGLEIEVFAKARGVGEPMVKVYIYHPSLLVV
jgi:hypothetical protein